MQFKTKINRMWFRTWCMKVRLIHNGRGKLDCCCLGLGWTSYVTLELFRFESGLFGLMMDKSFDIDVI